MKKQNMHNGSDVCIHLPTSILDGLHALQLPKYTHLMHSTSVKNHYVSHHIIISLPEKGFEHLFYKIEKKKKVI